MSRMGPLQVLLYTQSDRLRALLDLTLVKSLLPAIPSRGSRQLTRLSVEYLVREGSSWGSNAHAGSWEALLFNVFWRIQFQLVEGVAMGKAAHAIRRSPPLERVVETLPMLPRCYQDSQQKTRSFDRFQEPSSLSSSVCLHEHAHEPRL